MYYTKLPIIFNHTFITYDFSSYYVWHKLLLYITQVVITFDYLRITYCIIVCYILLKFLLCIILIFDRTNMIAMLAPSNYLDYKTHLRKKKRYYDENVNPLIILGLIIMVSNLYCTFEHSWLTLDGFISLWYGRFMNQSIWRKKEKSMNLETSVSCLKRWSCQRQLGKYLVWISFRLIFFRGW